MRIQEHAWALGHLRRDGGLGPASSFSAVTLALAIVSVLLLLRVLFEQPASVTSRVN